MEKRLKHFELQETKNYDLFKFYKENREINRNKVEEYKKSIKEKGLKQPINVKFENGFYKITDGQHRFVALYELGYYILFIVDYDENYSSEDIIEINSNRSNTRTKDYIHYYATKGFVEYENIYKIYKQYPTISTTLLNEIFIVSKMPKNPSYKITESIKRGEMIIDYKQGETLLFWLEEISNSNKQDNLYQSKIVRALKHIYNNNKNFNIKLFCSKIKNHQIPVENNEYKIVTNIKEKYNKRIRQNDLLLV